MSAFHTRFTKGYEWPTSIEANIKMRSGALGHLTSSTDFMLPYTFGVELMGDKATVRDTLIAWDQDQPWTSAELRQANPFPEVTLRKAATAAAARRSASTAIMPDSADVSHHPFQDEIDELVDAVRKRARRTSTSSTRRRRWSCAWPPTSRRRRAASR